MEQNSTFADAARLAEALTVMAAEYQIHFRAENDSDKAHHRAMSQIADRWDPEPSRLMIRRLEMAGCDGAAAAFDKLSTAVFRVVAALDVHWAMEDAVADINIDIAPLRDLVLHELSCASPTSWEQQPQFALLTDAAALADVLFSLGLEYQSYSAGCLPSPDDEDPIESHLKRVADDYDQLLPAPIILRLELAGFASAASAIADLAAAACHIIRNFGDGQADERQIVDNLTAKRDRAIDALKTAR